MQFFQWCCMTLIIIIESIASEVQPKPTARAWNNLINGQGILGVELLIAINELASNSETTDDQVILFDAPVNQGENRISDSENVKDGNGSEGLLKILAQRNLNTENAETRNQETVRRTNRTAKETKTDNQQPPDSRYKPVQTAVRGYLPEAGLHTIIPAPEPTIISGDTYFPQQLPEPIQVPIAGSILKPNSYRTI